MWAATGQPEICCKSGVPPREPDCGIARETELVWVSQVTRRDLGTRIQTKGAPTRTIRQSSEPTTKGL